jgi:hypothetical protein
MIGVILEVPVMIQGGAILVAAAHMYHEVEAVVSVIATVAGAEGSFWFHRSSMIWYVFR